jgi:ribonuclease HIII
METLEKSARNIIKKYSDILLKNGYNSTEPEKRGFAYFSEIIDSETKVILQVYFGKKGNKVVIQGNKESKLYNKIYKIVFGEKLFVDETKSIDEPGEYIGTDESGKGDYFGPLVIAGVYVDKELTLKLRDIDVKDSKLISDSSIKILASKIKTVLKDKYEIIFISPEKYNKLHEKMANTNLILGWGHAKVLENVLKKCEANEAISDRFGNEKLIRDSLQEKGRSVELHQITRAERYTAVAAASILAREAVINWFNSNSKKLGIDLPKGASEQVEETAKILIEKFGTDTFNKLVKLHFKSTKRVLK